MTAAGYTVSGALPLIFHINSDRIVTRAPLPKGLYDFVVTQPSPPKAGEDMDKLLQMAVESAFGLKAEKQTNRTNAFRLKVKQSDAPGLVASVTGGTSLSTSLVSGRASVRGVAAPIATIASILEDRLQTPVIDETGLTNRYDFSLEWKQESWLKPALEALKQAVMDQLGLELVADRCPVEVLAINPVGKEEK
jgi:uncharacterized protein (TIGR03435 family)